MNPRGPYKVGRGFTIGGQFLEKKGGSDQVGKDLTDAKYVARFRAFVTRGTDAFVVNVVLTKIKARNPDGTEVVETAGASGWVSGYVPAITAPYARLICEVVLVDTSVEDLGTTTDDSEEQGVEWSTAVLDAAVP